jgi:hypothetical protein
LMPSSPEAGPCQRVRSALVCVVSMYVRAPRAAETAPPRPTNVRLARSRLLHVAGRGISVLKPKKAPPPLIQTVHDPVRRRDPGESQFTRAVANSHWDPTVACQRHLADLVMLARRLGQPPSEGNHQAGHVNDWSSAARTTGTYQEASTCCSHHTLMQAKKRSTAL